MGVDFIGLVFAEQSSRRVTIHEARQVIAGLRAPARVGSVGGEAQGERQIPRRWFDSSAHYFEERLRRRRPLVVGVFANQPATIVNAVADRVGLDLVQLHGDEPWEEALAIRRPVVKAVRLAPGVAAATVLEEIEVGTASLCLLDAAVPGRFGGTGARVDWTVAAEISREIPVMLAGGLTPENVAGAIERVRPWAVDVSSGVERNGVKDAERIEAFVAAVRCVDGERVS
jgi:anthranilate synthase/indole-3-glycerol phosphate synthase/phosphoribosylanthranilate isomerase